jgi:hypothetical protein
MPPASHLLSIAALASGLGDDTSLNAVRCAQFMLQAHTWTEVVRIENSGLQSRYPRTVNALVFQLDSVLWFYTPTDGTQSLSLLRGRAEADKSNLGPLLAAIDAGFTGWEVVPPAGPTSNIRERPPNGCFVESMAILFQRLERGALMENPKLLSYYVSFPGGIRGHTVLQFTSGGWIQIVDPDRPESTKRIHYANENDPTSVAARIRGDIAKARHLPLGEFLYRASARYYATLPAHPSNALEQALPTSTKPPGNNRS